MSVAICDNKNFYISVRNTRLMTNWTYHRFQGSWKDVVTCTRLPQT